MTTDLIISHRFSGSSATIREYILFVRTHLTAAASTIFLALIICSIVFQVPIKIFFGISVFCALLSTIGFIAEYRTISYGKQAGHLEEWGVILTYYAYPCPGTSMLEALKESAGINPEEIEEIKLQTCNFDNPYLLRLSDYFAKSGIGERVKIEIVGVGDDRQENDLHSRFPHAKVYRSATKLTSHFNLIKARGRCFLWYEPVHDDTTSVRYTPSEGAFLVDVRDESRAVRRFYQDVVPEALQISKEITSSISQT